LRDDKILKKRNDKNTNYHAIIKYLTVRLERN
jgi:hypothetical protein